MDCIHCGAKVESGVCTNTACPLSKTNPKIRRAGTTHACLWVAVLLATVL
ncbi:hypothetical protein [Pseudofrankia sp. DC12]|nr:hypothetical protein [Pseudofrankia sp. DC12]